MNTNAPSTAGDDLAGNSTLPALRIAEELACGRYLEARKSMLRLATWFASVAQLAAEQPGRADYRTARERALDQYRHAALRTRLAYAAWQRAARIADTEWSDTTGRERVTAVREVA